MKPFHPSKILFVPITATLLFASVIQAETTTLIPSKTWNPSTLPRSPSEVQDSWTNSIDAAAWWTNLFAEKAIQKDIQKTLNESIAHIMNDLQWTGEGALINIRLIRLGDPNTPLQAAGLLGDKAWYAGSGRNPEEALFEFWRTPHLRSAVPDGWNEDPLGDNYFWVTLDAQGRIHKTVVPRGLASDLIQRAQSNFHQFALQAYQRSWSATDTWQTIAKTARKRLSDQKAKQDVDAALTAVKQSQARVAEANTKLQAALDSEHRAGQALMLVKTMQGILTVAQLVQEVRTILNEPVPALSNASNATAVINTTQMELDGKVQQRTQMAAAFDGSLDDLQKFLNVLRGLAKQAGAPPIIDEKTTIQRQKLLH